MKSKSVKKANAQSDAESKFGGAVGLHLAKKCVFSGPQSKLATPVFLVTMLMLLTHHQISALTFLAPTGSLPWSGTCPPALGACASAASPCTWPTTDMLALIVVGQCDIVLNAGNYGGKLLSWPLTLGLGGSLNAFQANGAVSGVNVSISGATAFSLSGYNGQTSTQASISSSSFSLVNVGGLLSFPVSISNVSLVDTSVSIAASLLQNGWTFPWQITESNITVTPTQTIFGVNGTPFSVSGLALSALAPSPASFSLLRSTVSLAPNHNTTLFKHISTASINITSSSVQATRLFGFNNGSVSLLAPTVSLTASSSSISNFLELFDSATTGPITIAISNSSVTGRSESDALAASGLPLGSVPPLAASRGCTSGTISSGSTLGFVQFNGNATACNINVTDSTFVNVEATFSGSSLAFSNTTIIRTADDFGVSLVKTGFTNMNATVGRGLKLLNLHSTILPWTFLSSGTSPSTASAFLPTGTVTLDSITLLPSATLKFASLVLTEGDIQGPTSATVTGSPIANNAQKLNNWLLGPINIDGAKLDLSRTQSLRLIPATYPPSNTSTLLTTSNGGAIVSSNGAFLNLLSVVWPATNGVPEPELWGPEWPLLSLENFTDPFDGNIFALTMTSEDTYPFYARSEKVGTTTTFYFHYGYPMAPNTCQGSLPPPFYCDHGEWKSNDAFTNTSLTLPSGSVSISGDVSVTTKIIVSSGTTTLTVGGCLITSEVSLTIDSRINITQSPGCTFDLYRTQASIRSDSSADSNKKSCSKYSVGREQSNEKTTLVLFVSVDNAGCNNKYIIAGSAVAGVVVVALVVAMVVYTCTKKTVSNTTAARHMTDA